MPLLPLFAAAGLCIASVHDGDTIRLCDGERVRLEGIDAPEVKGSPRCSSRQRQMLVSSKNPPWCDFKAGAASRDHLRAFMLTGQVSIERLGHDRYRRTLARIYVGGREAGDYLVKRGLARQWRK